MRANLFFSGILASAAFVGFETLPAAAQPAMTTALPAAILATKTVTMCSTLLTPPMEFVSASGVPQGGDVELGTALARHLGLTVKWVQVPFAGLVPDLLARHCDAIISQLYVKPARLAVMDMIPYMTAQETIMSLTGKTQYAQPLDLSGHKVGTVTGTTAAALLAAANKTLQSEGQRPINIVTFPDNVEALQQLEFGQIDAYALTYETGSYYTAQAPQKFQISVQAYDKTLTGIGVRKDEPSLRDALISSLAAIQKDGTYGKIFKKWNILQDRLSS